MDDLNDPSISRMRVPPPPPELFRHKVRRFWRSRPPWDYWVRCWAYYKANDWFKRRFYDKTPR